MSLHFYHKKVEIDLAWFCSLRMELRSLKMRKVFATLRALVEVMEALSKDADTDVGMRIMEEVTSSGCDSSIKSSLLLKSGGLAVFPIGLHNCSY